MEDLIEIAVVDLLTTNLTSYSNNWPAHIERYLDDYDLQEDYPIVVVNVAEEAEESMQIEAYTIEYIMNIYIVCVDSNYADAQQQRRILKDRIKNYMRSNIFLDHLTSPDTNERVQYTRYRTTEFSVGGFVDDWQSLARIEYEVLTERVGPF